MNPIDRFQTRGRETGPVRLLAKPWRELGFVIHWDMLKKPAREQTALEIVTLDSLVPRDHLLRRIDAVIDFSFIHARVAGLYCADNGRPPLDPTLMFKALFAIITDSHVTAADVHDTIVYRERLDRQCQRFPFDVKTVGLDASYATSGIARGLEDRQILGVTGYRNPTPPKEGMMRKSKFVFETETDGYRCPQSQVLTCATTGRNGDKHYRSDPAICRECPLLASCTTNAKAERTITRHVWHPPCLGRGPRTHRQPPQDALGQGDLQVMQGDGRTFLCRRQAASRQRYARVRA